MIINKKKVFMLLRKIWLIKNLNIIVIKVIRPLINKTIDEHISENEYEKIPNCIELLNDGSIEQFLENFELLNAKNKIVE